MMLEVNNINVFYGAIHAISDISFHVEEGEVVTLIGANGAGKSTILKPSPVCCTPKTGNIHFLGNDISTANAYSLTRMGLSHVPEGRRIFQALSVEENLEMGAYTRPKGEIRDSLTDVFDRFPRLKERRRQVAGTLSGGEQQMLAIGRADV